MLSVSIHNKEFELYISKSELEKIIDEIAQEMEVLKNSNPIFVIVLNGSFLFAADLLKKLSFDPQVDFIKVKSYVGMESSGEMTQSLDLSCNIENRTIVLIEDIVDTGNTLHFLINNLKKKNPEKIYISSLLCKPDSYKYPYKIDFLGKNIPNKFVVGYGLDYEELGRTLPEIYKLKDN